MPTDGSARSSLIQSGTERLKLWLGVHAFGGGEEDPLRLKQVTGKFEEGIIYFLHFW